MASPDAVLAAWYTPNQGNKLLFFWRRLWRRRWRPFAWHNRREMFMRKWLFGRRRRFQIRVPNRRRSWRRWRRRRRWREWRRWRRPRRWNSCRRRQLWECRCHGTLNTVKSQHLISALGFHKYNPNRVGFSWLTHTRAKVFSFFSFSRKCRSF